MLASCAPMKTVSSVAPSGSVRAVLLVSSSTMKETVLTPMQVQTRSAVQAGARCALHPTDVRFAGEPLCKTQSCQTQRKLTAWPVMSRTVLPASLRISVPSATISTETLPNLIGVTLDASSVISTTVGTVTLPMSVKGVTPPSTFPEIDVSEQGAPDRLMIIINDLNLF